MLTRKQRNLMNCQHEDRLITYLNSAGVRVFGLERLVKADVYTTCSLRSAFTKGMVRVLPETFEVTLASGTYTANYCEIFEKED